MAAIAVRSQRRVSEGQSSSEPGECADETAAIAVMPESSGSEAQA